MNESKKYYIGSGLKHMMFTLRAQWTQVVPSKSVDHLFPGTVAIPRDQYVTNLSTDAEQAKVAAIKWAKKNNIAVGSIDLSVDFTLDEIQRRTRLEKAAEEEALEKERAERAGAKEAAQISDVLAGIFPFGKKRGQRFEDVWKEDVEYVHYWLEREYESSDYSVAIALTKVLRAMFKRRPKALNEHFGSPGEKHLSVPLTLVRLSGFGGHYGWVNIYTFHDAAGRALVYRGGKELDLADGDQVKVNFKIKAHDEYRGNAQTLIYYLKIVA